MSWGDVTFDADLTTRMLRDLLGAPALYPRDVELGKSARGHSAHDRSRQLQRLGGRSHHRGVLGTAECCGRGGPVEDATWAIIEAGGDAGSKHVANDLSHASAGVFVVAMILVAAIAIPASLLPKRPARRADLVHLDP